MKRPRDELDTPASSSSLYGPSGSSDAAESPTTSPYAYLRTPNPLPVPADSPSNPFGIYRTLKPLSLPRKTGFGKHIVLRFQLVSTHDHWTPKGKTRLHAYHTPESPYRIVQVPLNFTFRHFHMLLLFLFASDARLAVRAPRRVFHSWRLRPYSALSPKSKVAAKEFSRDMHLALEKPGESSKSTLDGHLFEVYSAIALYKRGYRPGVIRSGSGVLDTRLSSTRERKLFPDLYDPDDVFGTKSAGSSGPLPDDPKAELDEESWDWEAEDDYTLLNIWRYGPDQTHGIVYHHTPYAAIHITVSTARIESRKGVGNTPYVFAAHGGTHGAVAIKNLAGESPDTPTVPIPDPKPKRTRKGAKADPPAPPAEPAVYDEVEDLSDGEIADESQLERWNAHDAFERFLKREAERERAVRRVALPPALARLPSGGPDPTKPASSSPSASGSPAKRARTASYNPFSPGRASSAAETLLALSSAASSRSSLALPETSSPSMLPVPDGGFDSDEEEGEEDTLRAHAQGLCYPANTPFPVHPAARRRVARASFRMEQITYDGLKHMVDSDDEAEKRAGEKRGGAEEPAAPEANPPHPAGDPEKPAVPRKRLVRRRVVPRVCIEVDVSDDENDFEYVEEDVDEDEDEDADAAFAVSPAAAEEEEQEDQDDSWFGDDLAGEEEEDTNTETNWWDTWDPCGDEVEI